MSLVSQQASQQASKPVSKQSCLYGNCFRHNASHQACAAGSGRAADTDPWRRITKIAGGGDDIKNETQPPKHQIILLYNLRN